MDSRVKEIIDRSRSVVFFGGAGVSTESNIPDFRSESGLYKAMNEVQILPGHIYHLTFSCSIRDILGFLQEKSVYPDARA